MTRPPPRLLWITPPAGSLESMVARLRDVKPSIAAELAVLLRRPGADARSLLDDARALAASRIPLVIHRRVDLALALGAAGVHLPERGLDPSSARVLFPNGWLGVSRHDRAGLEAAVGVADYATLSPFGSVAGKGPPLGEQGFRKEREGIGLPVLALGGIEPALAPAAVAAGANGFAFIRAGSSPLAMEALAAALPPRQTLP